MSENNQEGTENKIPRDFGAWIPKQVREWVKANPLWTAAHIFNLLVAIFLYFGKASGVPILPVVIFMCIIFVHIYTEPIKSIPVEADQNTRAELQEIRSRQRNKWMIFAYSFMLISLLLTFYPFINPLFSSTGKTQIKSDETTQQGTDEQNPTKPDEEVRYLNTLRERPIGVFIGCSLDNKAENLRCEPKNKIVANPDGSGQPQVQAISSDGVGKAWTINIGGYIEECTPDDKKDYGKSVTCKVRDGLLIPLYFIIMALMGGSISLTRRLPELQKQAGSEHIATERQPKLSQYEFREYLIFQMVQFISAPFLAILAYYLIEPSNTTNAVVLAFTAGFASETILLMVRSVANKITPETNAIPQYGAIAGVIKFADAIEDDRKRVKVEVFLTELPHQAHAIVDDQGLYTLSNVPVGEHSISVKSIDSDKILKKDMVKVAYAQTIFKKNITITKQEIEKAQEQPQPQDPPQGQ